MQTPSGQSIAQYTRPNAKVNKTTKTNTDAANNSKAAAPAADGTVEVLYQKMGDRWFAFSIVDEEVFVGSISPETIAALETGKSSKGKKTGNS